MTTMTEANVRVLGRQPDADVVELLRDALDRAERGEIVAIAYACVRAGKETSTTFCAGYQDHTVRLIGALEHLKHRLNLQLDTD